MANEDKRISVRNSVRGSVFDKRSSVISQIVEENSHHYHHRGSVKSTSSARASILNLGGDSAQSASQKRNSVLSGDKAALKDDDSATSEDEGHSKAYNFIHHNIAFEGICAVPIMMNCMFIGIVLDWCDKVEGCEEDRPIGFAVAEHTFCAWFLIEWLLRVGTSWQDAQLAGLKHWITSRSNKFDTFLVWVPGVMLTWAFATVFSLRTKRFLGVLRVLRAFRLMRFVKVMRHNSKFRNMWLLVRGLAESMPTLSSASTLIIFNLYVFGIFATELIGHSDAFSGSDPDSVRAREAQQMFKDLGTSMVTLIRFMHGDDAQTIMDDLLIKLPYIYVFLWAFIGTSSYVLMNLVTAIIVNQALENQHQDDETMAKMAKLKQEQEMAALKEVFESLDKDGSNELDFEEFQGAFKNSAMRAIMGSLGIQQEELMDLFSLLDTDEEGQLSLEEFSEGIAHLRGDAMSKDMITMIKTIERVEKCAHAIRHAVTSSGIATDQKDDSGSEISNDSEDEHVIEEIETVRNSLENRLGKVGADMEKIAKLLESISSSKGDDGGDGPEPSSSFRSNSNISPGPSLRPSAISFGPKRPERSPRPSHRKTSERAAPRKSEKR